VRELVRGVEATEEFVAANGFRIENGQIVKTEDTGGLLDVVLLQTEVQGILVRAAEIDTELNSVLKRVLSSEIDDAGATSWPVRAARDR
jgi:hypothetical protein